MGFSNIWNHATQSFLQKVRYICGLMTLLHAFQLLSKKMLDSDMLVAFLCKLAKKHSFFNFLTLIFLLLSFQL